MVQLISLSKLSDKDIEHFAPLFQERQGDLGKSHVYSAIDRERTPELLLDDFRKYIPFGLSPRFTTVF